MSETPTGTDRVELTEDERERLWSVVARNYQPLAYEIVGSIVAARVQALTAERPECQRAVCGYFDDLQAARAELAAANARCAELEQWHAKCDEVGVPHDPDGLVRHHRNNEAATQGAWKLTAQLAIEQNAALQETLDRVTATFKRYEDQGYAVVRFYGDDQCASTAIWAVLREAGIDRRAALTPEGKKT